MPSPHPQSWYSRSAPASEASLTAYSRLEPARAGVEVYTAAGGFEVATVDVSASAAATLVDEFVTTARSWRPHRLDVLHGLHLQRLLALAAQGLGTVGGGHEPPSRSAG